MKAFLQSTIILSVTLGALTVQALTPFPEDAFTRRSDEFRKIELLSWAQAKDREMLADINAAYVDNAKLPRLSREGIAALGDASPFLGDFKKIKSVCRELTELNPLPNWDTMNFNNDLGSVHWYLSELDEACNLIGFDSGVSTSHSHYLMRKRSLEKFKRLLGHANYVHTEIRGHLIEKHENYKSRINLDTYESMKRVIRENKPTSKGSERSRAVR